MRANRQWKRRELLEGEESQENGLPEMGSEEVEKVEEILGYKFRDKSLLWEALTHPSFYYPYKPMVTYKRLKFVGDAVLNCVVAHWVFSEYPDLAPGPLTSLRAANVDTERLARVAVCSNLHLYIRHQAPQLNEQIEEFMAAIKDYPDHSNGLLDPPKVLADIVESLLGAIFMDSERSSDIVWETFQKLAEPLIDLQRLGRHPVAELYELCQKKKLNLEFVKDAWERRMIVEVLINGTRVVSATYGNKKEIAMNHAAKRALDSLKEDEVLLVSTSPTNRSYGSRNEKSISRGSLAKLWTRPPSPAWLIGSLLIAGTIKLMMMLSTTASA